MTSTRLSSVASALLLLKTFSQEDTELGISSMASRLGLAKSTVHRLAVTLASEGFLEQNQENGRYRLGLSLFALGVLVRRRMDVSNLGMTLLRSLRDLTQESVHLAILTEGSIVYLYNVEGAQAIGARSYLGAHKPAFCTAEGRVLLAFGSAQQVHVALADPLEARTPKTVTDPKVLLELFGEVRRLGYAIDDEESEFGMRGVAAPIRNVSGTVVAAVGLAGPVQRLPKKKLLRLSLQVISTADAVSTRLGYQRH